METQSSHFRRRRCFTSTCTFETNASLTLSLDVNHEQCLLQCSTLSARVFAISVAHTLANSTPAALHCACKKKTATIWQDIQRPISTHALWAHFLERKQWTVVHNLAMVHNLAVGILPTHRPLYQKIN